MTTPESFSDEIERFLLAYYWMPEATFDFIALRAMVRFGEAAPCGDEIAAFLCRAWRGKRYLNRFHRDQMVTGWLLINKDSGTTDQIGERCAATFGRDRAPSRTTLAAFLRGTGTRGRRTAGAAIDATMARWIGQVAPHVTVTVLLAALASRFPGRPMPSRSQLHRYARQRGIATAGHEAHLASNPALRDWLRAHARYLTLAQLRNAAATQFGPAAMPSRSAIHRLLQSRSPTGHKTRPGWPADVEAWMLERRGSLSLDALRAAAVAKFGPGRTPSRSAIGRRILRARAQEAMA